MPAAPPRRARAAPLDAARRRACDGAGLREAFRAAVRNLELHVDEINALNVYPVPDGDTGSNLLATVRAALGEAESVDDPTLPRIAAAISFGALMGARGNSGVITSQIFRGMAEGVGDKSRFTGLDLAHALTAGSRSAYRAVVMPVEGTILTVIREASAAAAGAAEQTTDVERVLASTVQGAEAALLRTPSLLPILEEAGVVDAGGAGLVRLFEGALQHLVGPAAAPTRERHRGARRIAPPPTPADGDDGFGYETMYLLEPADGATLDLDAIRSGLEAIGESVLVAGDARAVRVHVHSQRPDTVIAFGMGHGALSRISVENLDAQTGELRERRAAAFARNGSATMDPPPGPAVSTPVAQAVVCVAAGDGIVAVFRSFGCSQIVSGGSRANPSAGELLAAVEATNAEHVLVLANHRNVIHAAHQVASMTRRGLSVVPTRNAAESLAALLAFDAAATAQENAHAMTQAARSIQTLQVTRAVRSARFGGRRVTKGQVIVLDADEGLVAADGDELAAVRAAVDSLRPGYELLTLYYGDGTDLAAAEALGRQLAAGRAGLEIEVVRGGQPHYRYLIAAE